MTTAMTSLHDRWGLSVSDIAQALNISQRAVRQARDSHAEEETYRAAEKLDAFLHQVHDYGIEEPGAWMSGAIVEGYTITRWDIYRAGRRDLLVDDAERRVPGEQMLDLHDSDWRRNYWTSFKTVEAADGGLSVVGKSYDDVRAQMPEGAS